MTVQSEKHWHEKTMSTHCSESRKGKAREKEAAEVSEAQCTARFWKEGLVIKQVQTGSLKYHKEGSKKLRFILVLIPTQIYLLKEACMHI